MQKPDCETLKSQYCDHEYLITLVESEEGIYGEADISISGKNTSLNSYETPFAATDYVGALIITKELEDQLLAMGFRPETTRAAALSIVYYAAGICFYDGALTAFYLPSCETHGYSPPRGMLYTFEQMGQDILDHIDEIAPVPGEGVDLKPVIYLYPEERMDVTVKVGYPEPFTYTYPAYENGWAVTAYPDGRLINKADGSEHYYLFWEGDAKLDWDFSEGFVVKGADAESFLLEKLPLLGLTPREYNDFITYWVPELQQNPYNLITFSTAQYEAHAPLTVTPAPDTVLRVHMVYKPCSAETAVKPQTLTPTPRKGFTVVEWGGTRGW